MPQSDLFQNLFPDLLENAAQEVGDLLGEALTLKDADSTRGGLQEVFAPPKKKFGLADFGVKGRDGAQAFLLFDLHLAVELAGRLIMLPKDEIKSAKTKGKLEGELLDAFSEVANIINGVMNSVCHEALPKQKLHFVKGNLEIYPPKTAELPLAPGPMTCFSGSLSLGDAGLGAFQFLFPHSLLPMPETEVQSEAAPDSETFVETPAPTAEPTASPTPEQPDPVASESSSGLEGRDQPQPETAEDSPSPGNYLVLEQVHEILIEGLSAAQEELGGLLGAAVEFTEQEVQPKQKQELLSAIKGKQTLTSIALSGEREGTGFMLLPVRDAIHFGGLLLMMPEESITQTVKQGKFEGEVTDAFDELANILIGCFSNHFQSAFPQKLALKKQQTEPLVPSQVDLSTEQPFPHGGYILVSAKIQMGGKTYGPLVFLFPARVLGLQEVSQSAASHAAHAAQQPGHSQKTDPRQKTDTVPGSSSSIAQGRLISIIGEDSEQCRLVEESIGSTDVDLIKLSLDGDFKEPLSRDNLCCAFLLMDKVNEQGLAKAIKVRSSLPDKCPLIVAGPEWTRSMVFKALKYGATDILITPADRELIQKKFSKYL